MQLAGLDGEDEAAGVGLLAIGLDGVVHDGDEVLQTVGHHAGKGQLKGFLAGGGLAGLLHGHGEGDGHGDIDVGTDRGDLIAALSAEDGVLIVRCITIGDVGSLGAVDGGAAVLADLPVAVLIGLPAVGGGVRSLFAENFAAVFADVPVVYAVRLIAVLCRMGHCVAVLKGLGAHGAAGAGLIVHGSVLAGGCALEEGGVWHVTEVVALDIFTAVAEGALVAVAVGTEVGQGGAIDVGACRAAIILVSGGGIVLGDMGAVVGAHIPIGVVLLAIRSFTAQVIGLHGVVMTQSLADHAAVIRDLIDSAAVGKELAAVLTLPVGVVAGLGAGRLHSRDGLEVMMGRVDAAVGDLTDGAVSPLGAGGGAVVVGQTVLLGAAGHGAFLPVLGVIVLPFTPVVVAGVGNGEGPGGIGQIGNGVEVVIIGHGHIHLISAHLRGGGHDLAVLLIGYGEFVGLEFPYAPAGGAAADPAHGGLLGGAVILQIGGSFKDEVRGGGGQLLDLPLHLLGVGGAVQPLEAVFQRQLGGICARIPSVPSIRAVTMGSARIQAVLLLAVINEGAAGRGHGDGLDEAVDDHRGGGGGLQGVGGLKAHLIFAGAGGGPAIAAGGPGAGAADQTVFHLGVGIIDIAEAVGAGGVFGFKVGGGVGLLALFRGGGQGDGGVGRGGAADVDAVIGLADGEAVEGQTVIIGDIVVRGVGEVGINRGEGGAVLLQLAAACQAGQALGQIDLDIIGLQAQGDIAIDIREESLIIGTVGLEILEFIVSDGIAPADGNGLGAVEGFRRAYADVRTGVQSAVNVESLVRVVIVEVQVVGGVFLAGVALNDGLIGQIHIAFGAEVHAAAAVIGGVILNGAAAHIELGVVDIVDIHAAASAADILGAVALGEGRHTGVVAADLAARHGEGTGAAEEHAAAVAAVIGLSFLIILGAGVVAGDLTVGEGQLAAGAQIDAAAALIVFLRAAAAGAVAADLTAGDGQGGISDVVAVGGNAAAAAAGGVILDRAAVHIELGSVLQQHTAAIYIGAIDGIIADLAAEHIEFRHRRCKISVITLHVDTAGVVAGDLAAEEVEFAGIVVHGCKTFIEAGDLAAIHIEGAACLNFDGADAVVVQITLRDDLAGGPAAVGEGERPVAGDADVGSIIVGVNDELVAVEAEADVGFIQVQRPSIVDGNVVEQIVVAAGLDGGEAVNARPRCVGSVIVVAVGGGVGVVAGAVGVGVGGLQIQTVAIGHQGAVGAVAEEDVGGRGAVYDLLCGDKIRIHADTGGGGQLVIVVADVDLRLFCVFADVEVAGGLALTLGVAGDVQGTAHGAGGHAAKVHAAALDTGGVIFNGAAEEIEGEGEGGVVAGCAAADGTAVITSGVILHGAAANDDLGRCVVDI